MNEQIMDAWSILLEKLGSWMDSIIINLPNMLLAILTFFIAYWISKNIQVQLNKVLKKVIKQAAIRNLITNVAAILIMVLGILLSLAIMNLDGTLKSLLAGAGVAGLAISLALQGTLSNTFSGIFIAIKDELNIGDYIESNGYAGEVVAIDLRNTKIKEADNNIVVIPNKLILEAPFKNFGLTKRIRTTITCGVHYESDLEKVEELTKDCIQKIFPENEKEQIEFFFSEFGDSSINFILRFWVDGQRNLKALEVKSTAIKSIKKTFDENSISIPYPIRTLINQV